MPGFLSNVVKGRFCGRSDERLRHRPDLGESVADCRARFAELKKRFEQAIPLHTIAAQKIPIGKDEAVARNPVEEAHARDEFFGDTAAQAFFPSTPGNSEDEIVRGAFIQALDLALATPITSAPKPIVTYWVVTGRPDGAPDAFEAFVAESPAEVHVLLLTPVPQNVPPPPPNGDIDEDMFVVASDARIGQIKLGFENAYPGKPPPFAPTGTAGVKCLRVVGY